MKTNFKIILLILILFGIFSLAIAEEEKSLISVESKVDKAAITIGDRIIYTLIIKSDPLIKLDPIPLGSNLGAFEIKDYKSLPPEKDKEGKIINRSEYNITTFTTGEYVIPPIEITYTDPKGEKKSISSERIFITVKSVGATQAEMEDIRGLKPPIDIKVGNKVFYIVGLLLIAITVLGWFYLRGKAKALKIPELPEELKKPAWEVALSELQQLKESDLLKKKLIKQFYINLSEIIRKYIQRRFQIVALDRTTQEIRQELKGIKIDLMIIEQINSFLQDCDLVKFAKFIPKTERIDENLKQATEIVDFTKPKEVLVETSEMEKQELTR
ncbi:MAG: BatD family protein [Candidatus Zixiibacteriota bacterium]